MKRRFAALLMLALSPAVAYAQVPEVKGLPIYGRVASDLAGHGLDEMIREVYGKSTAGKITGSAITRALPNAGKFIRWGGAYVLVPTLINSALNWYLQQAQDAANTPLGQWWGGSDPSGPIFPFPKDTPNVDTAYAPKFLCNSTTQPYTYYIYKNSYHGMMRGAFGQYGQQAESFDLTKPRDCTDPTLEETALKYPSLPADISKTVINYINTEGRNDIRPYLDPVPNQNQWEDNPYGDDKCLLDTDKDGASDCAEFEDQKNGGPADPNDPTKKPATGTGEVSRETVTRCVGNTCVTTTIIKYGDGKTSTVKKTVTKETVDNGDGTETTTTTTTLETTGKDGEATRETKTEKETKDKGYEKEKSSCIAGGGTWNSDNTCTPESDEAKKEANCKAQGGTWENGSCTPKKDPDEKKRKCLAAGREWDDINETCKDEKKEDKPEPNNCGDMDNVKRILQHPGSWAKDLIVPCEPPDWGEFKTMLDGKFPFSTVAAMNKMFDTDSNGNGQNPLPTKLGPFTLDFSFAAAFFAFIKVGFRALLFWFLGVWLLDRLSGQVVLS